MANNVIPDLLFGSLGDVVPDGDARTEVRMLALNLQSPSVERARALADYLYESRANVVLLSELKRTEACHTLVKELEASKFNVHVPWESVDSKYLAGVATKGFTVQILHDLEFSGRVAAVRLGTHLGPLDVVSLYSVTIGMTPESSPQRASFQRKMIQLLHQRQTVTSPPPLLVAGDFNVIEPDHVPSANDFKPHDYEFYSSFAQSGMIDAYRAKNPDGKDTTWYGAQGGRRLDHAFLSEDLAPYIAECLYDHSARTRRLSDHSAMRLTLR